MIKDKWCEFINGFYVDCDCCSFGFFGIMCWVIYISDNKCVYDVISVIIDVVSSSDNLVIYYCKFWIGVVIWLNR